jgi:NADH-quinone oxidoreductase subunit N
MSHIQNTFMLLAPELVLFGWIMLVMMFDLFVQQKSSALRLIAMLGLITSALFSLRLQSETELASLHLAEQFASVVTVDRLALFLKTIILSLAAATLWFCDDAFEEKNPNPAEFYLLVMLASLGGCLCVSSQELITFFLAFELLSLPLYALTAYRRYQSKSAEAGLKYFLMGALSSAIMLFGMSWVFGSTGSTQLAQVVEVFQSQTSANHGLLLGLILIFVGLAFKVAAAPFHNWAPDAYSGAPTIVASFLSTAPKAAIVGFTIRLYWCQMGVTNQFYQLPMDWIVLFSILSLLSMFLGNLSALPQQDCKRILAYSGIAQIGYLFLGLTSCSKAFGAGSLGLGSTLFYLAGYVVANFLAWTSLALACKDRPDCTLKSLNGLWKRSPLLAFCLAISLMSLAGVPPLVGFAGKFGLFVSIYQAKLPFLMVFGVINSVIALFYYFKILKAAFFSDIAAPEGTIALNVPIRFGLQLFCFLIVVLGLSPSLLNTCQSIAISVLP